jgi:hypothetical protein
MMMQRGSQTFLARLIKPNQVAARTMSTSASIQTRFEKAYVERMASMAKKSAIKYVVTLVSWASLCTRRL